MKLEDFTFGKEYKLTSFLFFADGDLGTVQLHEGLRVIVVRVIINSQTVEFMEKQSCIKFSVSFWDKNKILLDSFQPIE